jgi:hypothetical protein
MALSIAEFGCDLKCCSCHCGGVFVVVPDEEPVRASARRPWQQ